MKYIIAVLLMIPALTIGALYWLWSFKKERFLQGCKVLDNKYGYGKLIGNLLED
jgi:hypothetical protein